MSREGGVSDGAGAADRRGVFGALRGFDEAVQKVEVSACVASLLVMILLAFVQVFLRQLQGGVFQPVPWFDNITRHLVIWVGMLGASLATAEGRHISIEALPRLLSSRGRRRLEVFANTAALVVTGLLLALAVIYLLQVQIPREEPLFTVAALDDLEVYRWPFLLVVPVTLTLICWRFGLRASEGLILPESEYRDREEEREEEVHAYEEGREEDEVALLIEHERQLSAESGEQPRLDPDSARAHLRESLQSDRQPPRPPPPPAAPVGRSTEELPVYSELHDEEDLRDPHERERAREASLAPRPLEDSDADEAGRDVLSSSSDIDVADDLAESEARTHRVPGTEPAAEGLPADAPAAEDDPAVAGSAEDDPAVAGSAEDDPAVADSAEDDPAAEGAPPPEADAPELTDRLPPPELPDEQRRSDEDDRGGGPA